MPYSRKCEGVIAFHFYFQSASILHESLRGRALVFPHYDFFSFIIISILFGKGCGSFFLYWEQHISEKYLPIVRSLEWKMNNGVNPFSFCCILLAYTPITMIHSSLLTVPYLSSIFHDALCMKSFHIPGGINYT